MYLQNMDEELNYAQDYSNFLPIFTEEKSFGNQVADDLAAISGQTQPQSLTPAAKAGIGLIGLGILGFVAYKIYTKKRRKN